MKIDYWRAARCRNEMKDIVNNAKAFKSEHPDWKANRHAFDPTLAVVPVQFLEAVSHWMEKALEPWPVGGGEIDDAYRVARGWFGDNGEYPDTANDPLQPIRGDVASAVQKVEGDG